jgi:hypothetical protein
MAKNTVAKARDPWSLNMSHTATEVTPCRIQELPTEYVFLHNQNSRISLIIKSQTREEIQRMRSTNDPIAGLKQKLLDWGVTSEEELKTIDKEARSAVDAEVAEAEKMAPPDPTPKILFEDIYVRGSEPAFMRGRIPEENFYYEEADIKVPKDPPAVART